VKWHDGWDFTADDVVVTIERVPNVRNSPGTFAGMIRAVTRAEIIDPLTIRFHTVAPHPLLPTELNSAQIISRYAGTGAETEDYNAGRAAIGTGPYRLASYRHGDRTEFTRNKNYWAGPQPWARVSYRFIANDASRTAALLTGDVDVIDQVPSSDLERLRRDQRITLYEIQGLRLIYLWFDYSRAENPIPVSDNEGKPFTRNPFHDVRVRRAVSIAIDRNALTERVMEGTAKPTGQWPPPGAFSYNPDVPTPRFDADGARRLLAEAGFPQGFRLTLAAPYDRGPNDARVAQAVAQMWTHVGLRTEVQTLPWTTYAARNSRQEFNARMGGWGRVTGEASYMLVNIFFDREKRRGVANSSRYSNPALDALTEQAAATLDDAEREKLLREAVKNVTTDEPAMTPLFQLVNVWAARRGFAHTPRMDERTTAMAVEPAN